MIGPTAVKVSEVLKRLRACYFLDLILLDLYVFIPGEVAMARAAAACKTIMVLDKNNNG